MKYNKPEVLALGPVTTVVQSTIKYIFLVFEVGLSLSFALTPTAYEADE